MVIERYGIYLVNLDPTVGAEMKKVRPCVVVSPDELNRTLRTVIIAPLTTTIRDIPSRVNSSVSSKAGQIAGDQLRVVDKIRLLKRLGTLEATAIKRLVEVILRMFA